MSLSVAPLARPFGITPSRLGRAPAFARRRRSCCARAFGEALAEGFVEVGADDALRVRPRERVAGAALGDELLLARDQVGVVLALDARSHSRAQQAGHPSRREAELAQAPGGGKRGHRRRNSIRRAGDAAPVDVSARRFARVRAVSTSQRYRLRNPVERAGDRDRGRARGDLPRPRHRRAAGDRGQAAAARPVRLAAAMGGGEPALLLLVRPARPEGPERLPHLRLGAWDRSRRGRAG